MSGLVFADLIRKLDENVFDVVSQVICSICHNVYTQPVTTDCGHTFCGGCIKRVLSNRNNSGCPLCKCFVNRRDLKADETQSLICDLVKEIAAGFKADVGSLTNDNDISLDDISTCKTFEFCSPGNDKKKWKKGRGSGNKTETHNFVPAVKKSTNITPYYNKKKEMDDLVSVSQMEPGGSFVASSGSEDKNLEVVKKVPPEEKINNWLEIAGENLFNTSNTSIFGEKGDESRASGMIRVDYNKDKGRDDPYEFIASQKNYVQQQKKKRGRKPNPNKKVPDFKTLQSFTKESVKRNQINLKDDPPEECFIRFDEKVLDEILSPERIPDTLKAPTMTASQKFEHLLEETKEDQTKHVLYSPKSDQSLMCTYESEPQSRNKPGCSKDKDKDSSDASDICLAELFSTPKQKRKKSNEGGAKKKSRIVEVLEEIKDSRRMTERNSSDGNASGLSRSPGWSRVSGLKNDFEKSKRGRPKKLKSLNVSGGEKSLNASRSNVSLEMEESLKRIELLVMKNGDDYIEDLSQASDVMSGFCSQHKNGEKVETYKRLVQGLEEELDRHNSDMVMRVDESSSAESEEVGKKDEKAVVSESSTAMECSSESPNMLEKPLALVMGDLATPASSQPLEISIPTAQKPETFIPTAHVPETPALTSHVPTIPAPTTHAPETPIPTAHVPTTPVPTENVPTTPVPTAHVLETLIPNAHAHETPSIAHATSTFTPINNRSRVIQRRKSRTIPFTLIGRVQKKKRSNTIFIRLGKLAPLLRSNPTTIKLVMPNQAFRRSQHRTSSLGVQTSTSSSEVKKIRDSFAQTSQSQHSVGVQMTQVVNVSTSAQTGQSSMRSVGVQSTERKEVSAQTSQLKTSSREVQMTQVQNADAIAQTTEKSSIGVQMTQVQNADAAAQTAQKPSIGVQAQNDDVVAQTSVGTQVSSQLEKSPLEVQMQNLPGVSQALQSPLLSARVPIAQVRNIPAAAQTPLQITQIRAAQSSPVQVSQGQSCHSPILPQQSESEWEEIENLDQVQTQPSQAKVVNEDSISLDPDMASEFNKTWQRVTQKKEDSQKQKSLRDYFSPKSGGHKKIRRISSSDLDSPIEVLPEKFEGQQYLPLDVEKVQLSETIDLDPTQKNTQEQLQDVYKNIEEDLARIKRIATEEEEKVAKSQGEESDSDIFVEQTPPKTNTSRIIELTQRPVPQNTENTEIIADSIPPQEIEACIEEFKTPPRPPKPILKTPHLGFPSKESFFRREEPDENDQNKINNETKTSQMKAIMQSWNKPVKIPISIASSSLSNLGLAKIKKFTEKFKCTFANSITREVTHLVVGLHKTEHDELLPLLTPKFLFALAYKKWIVTEGWIDACLKANAIVSEGPYESPDSQGGNSCRRSRLSTEPLFKDLEIYLHGEFERLSKQDLESVLTACGATVIQNPASFSFRPTRIRVILVDRECNDYEVDEMQGLFKKYKTAVLAREFVVTSIETYKIANFTPYLMTLTSEDELCDLGYPYLFAKHEEESEAVYR